MLLRNAVSLTRGPSLQLRLRPLAPVPLPEADTFSRQGSVQQAVLAGAVVMLSKRGRMRRRSSLLA